MTGLDTTVRGDPDSVSAAADGIGALGGGLGQASAGLGGAVNRSTGEWTGGAADAFRDRITGAQQSAETAAGATTDLQNAVQTFAGQLAEVKSQIQHATSIAAAAGLTVTATSIQQPVQPPAPPVVIPGSLLASMTSGYQRAAAQYVRQRAAYQQAEQIILRARQQETQAHVALTAAIAQAERVLGGAAGDPAWLTPSAALTTADQALDQAQQWAARAVAYGDQVGALTNGLVDLAPVTPAFATAVQEQSQIDARQADGGDDQPDLSELAFGIAHSGVSTAENAGTGLSMMNLGRDLANPDDRVQHVTGDLTDIGTNALGQGMLDGACVAAPETFGTSFAIALGAWGTGQLVEHYEPDIVKGFDIENELAGPSPAQLFAQGSDDLMGTAVHELSSIKDAIHP